MYHEVNCYSNLFTHPDYRYGSLPGALVSLLNSVTNRSHTKVSRFIDHKGEVISWTTVRTALSSPKVQSSLNAKIKTTLTDEGMIFYKWNQKSGGRDQFN